MPKTTYLARVSVLSAFVEGRMVFMEWNRNESNNNVIY